MKLINVHLSKHDEREETKASTSPVIQYFEGKLCLTEKVEDLVVAEASSVGVSKTLGLGFQF